MLNMWERKPIMYLLQPFKSNLIASTMTFYSSYRNNDILARGFFHQL